MRDRKVWVFIGIVLVFVLALMGTGFVVAAMHEDSSAGDTAQASVSQSKLVFGATQVYMRNDNFSPARIEVVLGTTVTWTNKDSDPHNVTIAPILMSSSNNWESGLLYPGQSFTYTFTSKGTFQYHCQEDAGMIGTVIVI